MHKGSSHGKGGVTQIQARTHAHTHDDDDGDATDEYNAFCVLPDGQPSWCNRRATLLPLPLRRNIFAEPKSNAPRKKRERREE